MINFGVINEIASFTFVNVTKVIIFFLLLYDYKRELIALLCLSSLCFLVVVWLFLTVPRVCL